jgi:hypothetical protein
MLAGAGLAPAGITRPQLLAAARGLLQLRAPDEWPKVCTWRPATWLQLLNAIGSHAPAQCSPSVRTALLDVLCRSKCRQPAGR